METWEWDTWYEEGTRHRLGDIDDETLLELITDSTDERTEGLLRKWWKEDHGTFYDDADFAERFEWVGLVVHDEARMEEAGFCLDGMCLDMWRYTREEVEEYNAEHQSERED